MDQTNRVRRSFLAGLLVSVIVPAGLAWNTAEAAPRRERKGRRIADEWVRLGSRRVDGRGDEDTIKAGERGTFRALMFRVTDSPARIKNVVVHFENGGTFKAEVQENFSKGERSSVIDLPGERRNIDHVTFHYTDLGRKDSAEVVLFGRR